MKLNKIVTVGVCAALAMSLVACGASSSSVAGSSEAASSSVAASSESAASSEKLTGVQNAAYTLRNDSGAKISEVYFYVNGSEKGDNLAADGLEADATIDVAQTYDADTEEAPTYTVEYVTEDGTTYVFDTLHFENATVGMVGANGTEADAAAAATVQGNF
jgi:hypothetical protein